MADLLRVDTTPLKMDSSLTGVPSPVITKKVVQDQDTPDRPDTQEITQPARQSEVQSGVPAIINTWGDMRQFMMSRYNYDIGENPDPNKLMGVAALVRQQGDISLFNSAVIEKRKELIAQRDAIREKIKGTKDRYEGVNLRQQMMALNKKISNTRHEWNTPEFKAQYQAKLTEAQAVNNEIAAARAAGATYKDVKELWQKKQGKIREARGLIELERLKAMGIHEYYWRHMFAKAGDDSTVEATDSSDAMTLPDGKIISKSWYSGLSSPEQSILNSQGYEAYLQDPQFGVVSLPGGETVSRLWYLGLTDPEKNEVARSGAAVYAQKQVESYITTVGGNIDYYNSLPDDKKQPYLSSIGSWHPIEGVDKGWQYDATGGETAAMIEKYASGEITEKQWLDWVAGAKERAAAVTIPSSPAEIERFITASSGSIDLYNKLPDATAKQSYLSFLNINNKVSSSLQQFAGIVKTARDYGANNVQVGPKENNEWLLKSDFDALTPQMQSTVMSGGLAALDVTNLTSWERLDKYKEWGLVSPLAEWAGERDGEPEISLPQGAIDWDRVVAMSKFNSSELFAEDAASGGLLLSMMAGFAKDNLPDLISPTVRYSVTHGDQEKKITQLRKWWDGLTSADRQQILGRWRNAPANLTELAARYTPKVQPALPSEQIGKLREAADIYGAMTFNDLSASLGGDYEALTKIKKGAGILYPGLGNSDQTVIGLWNGADKEERARIITASTTTKQQQQIEQYNQAVENTKDWMGDSVEWAQNKVAGGDNWFEQGIRGIGSGIVQLGLGAIGLGLAEIETVGSLLQGNFKSAGLGVSQVPIGMAAGVEAQVKRIGQTPATGLGEAVGMYAAPAILVKIPPAIRSGAAFTKIMGSKVGIPARAIAGSDFSAFYVEPPKGLRLLATDIREVIAQNKELAHEILYNPKGNKIGVNEQITMLKEMMNPEAKMRLDLGLDIVNDITHGPAAPESMYMKPVEALASVKSVPSKAIAQAIVKWAQKNKVEIGGSTAELAQAKGIKDYHIPNDVDYYALSGSVETLVKTLLDQIAKVVGKNNVRAHGGTIEIRYNGEWIKHGTIHTTTEFGEGLPFGVKPKIVEIGGVKFMDYREQALRRFRSIITPTGEGGTGVELAWRAKDYQGWDRIISLADAVNKQKGLSTGASLLTSKLEAFNNIPAGRKLSLNDYYFDKNGMTVGDLVEAVGDVQAKTLTADPIQVRPPKSADILSDNVDTIIDTEKTQAKKILYSGKYSRDEQVAWIKSRLNPENQVRVERLTNILGSINDGPAIPKSMLRRAVDAFNTIEGNPGRVASSPLAEWLKTNSDRVAVGGRTAVNAQNKGSKYVKAAGDLDVIVLKGEVEAIAKNLTDVLNKELGEKVGQAGYGSIDKDSAFIEVYFKDTVEWMRIELHRSGMYEPHMPFGASEKYINIDGVKFQDLRQQIANRVDSVLHLTGLGQVDVRWAGRLKDLGNLDREIKTYAEGLRRSGRVSQARALELQIEEFEKLPKGEEIPVDKYVEMSTGLRVDKFLKGAPRTQSIDVPVKYRAKANVPSTYDLIRQTTPMSRMMPDVMYHATRGREILNGFTKDGKIVAGKMYGEAGQATRAPRAQLYTSINAAMDYLIDPATGKVPSDAIIIAVRTTAEDIGPNGVIKMASRAEPLGIEKGVMRRGVLDEGTLDAGAEIYPTAPNNLALSKRGVTDGITGESITNFSIYGRTIPIIWGRTFNAMKAGLETPDASLLKTVKILALKETFRDLLHPHLPKKFKVSESREPIPSSSLIKFGKETYTWRKPKATTPKEIAQEIHKTNTVLDKAAKEEAAPRIKRSSDIKEADDILTKSRDKIDEEIIDNTLKEPEVVDYFKKHAKDAAEFYKLRNTYVINLRKLLTSIGLESAIYGETLFLDSLAEKMAPSAKALSASTVKATKSSESISAPRSKISSAPSSASSSVTSSASPSATPSVKPSPSSGPSSRGSSSTPALSSTPPAPPTTTPPPPTFSTRPSAPPRYLKLKKEAGTNLSKHDLAASVAWNQGKLKGRGGELVDQYIVIHPPYTRESKFYTTKVPTGVPVVDGPRSAYETIRRITGGNLPPEIWVDMGIFDVKIISTKEVPKLKFVPDTDQKTRQGHIKVLPRRGPRAPRVGTSR